MTSETQALITDPAVELAARLLALGENRQDGWCRAEDISLLSEPSNGLAPPEIKRWERRLDTLLGERPDLRAVLDGGNGYPANLRRVEGRPALLFVDGAILERDDRALAVVGSRQAEDVAICAAFDIASGLAVAGFTIVSGLARGVDTAAHKGALAAGGRTIAVVGTGIAKVFPPENGGLVDRIRRRGAVVSQFPPGHGPTKTTFPARNGVIAGLSLGSVVVTASERSGTRIEIDRTLAQNRPVFLWAPYLNEQAWARRLAESPLVHLVASVEEIERLISTTPKM